MIDEERGQQQIADLINEEDGDDEDDDEYEDIDDTEEDAEESDEKIEAEDVQANDEVLKKKLIFCKIYYYYLGIKGTEE